MIITNFKHNTRREHWQDPAWWFHILRNCIWEFHWPFKNGQSLLVSQWLIIFAFWSTSPSVVHPDSVNSTASHPSSPHTFVRPRVIFRYFSRNENLLKIGKLGVGHLQYFVSFLSYKKYTLIVLSFLIVSNLKKTNTLTVFAQADTNYG